MEGGRHGWYDVVWNGSVVSWYAGIIIRCKLWCGVVRMAYGACYAYRVCKVSVFPSSFFLFLGLRF